MPSSRPSERPTLKTLPPVEEAKAGTSNTDVIELSASALDSDPSVIDLDRLLKPRSSRRLRSGRGDGGGDGSGRDVTTTRLPRRFFAKLAARGTLALAAVTGGFLVVAFGASPAGTASLEERVTGVGNRLVGPARVPREPGSQHTELVLRPLLPEVPPPAGRCALAGASKVLATRANLGPGLDVNAISGGFGVGFASSVDEALGVRLDGSALRIADRVRVRAGAGAIVKHVAVDAGRHEDDAIDLRVDADDARTVVPEGDTTGFRVAVVGGWIQVVRGFGAAGRGQGKGLWPVPGGAAGVSKAGAGAGAGAPASASARAGAGGASASARARASASTSTSTSTSGGAKGKAGPGKAEAGGARVHDGFVRLGDAPARRASAPIVVSAPVPDVRAAARDDGGAVIALRRPSALWLGLLDAHLSPDGPLLALTRPGAAIGMPSVAQVGSGGAVAWAERPAGDRDWIVMVASFAGGEDRARSAPMLRPVGAGMSPSIAPLPDGELLLAYAVGVSGSHRVVVVRLGRDLEPRGEPVVVSPDELNAGQPAAAVGADGRGLVAFFGAERGHPASVLATPFSCAPPL